MSFTRLSQTWASGSSGEAASSNGGSSAGGGNNAYYAKPSGTNADGVSTYTAATQVTVTGLPFAFTKYDIESIRQSPLVGDDTVLSDKADFAVSSGVITVTGATFVATDKFVVTLTGPDKAYDQGQNLALMQMVNGPWNPKAPVPLLTAAQPLTTAFADIAGEISMGGDNLLSLFLTIDINDASNIEIRFLHKHESSGAEEYREVFLRSHIGNIKTINLSDYRVGANADQLFKITIPTHGTSPYVQVQARMVTDGGVDADIDLAYYTTAWSAAVDNQNPTLSDDEYIGSSITEDVFHYAVHEGIGFHACCYVATGDSFICFKTPDTANYLHVLMDLSGEKNVVLEIWRGVTPGGTSADKVANNANDSAIDGGGASAILAGNSNTAGSYQVNQAFTGGTRIYDEFQAKNSGGRSAAYEKVLEKNTWYGFKIDNIDNADCGLNLTWFEVPHL